MLSNGGAASEDTLHRVRALVRRSVQRATLCHAAWDVSVGTAVSSATQEEEGMSHSQDQKPRDPIISVPTRPKLHLVKARPGEVTNTLCRSIVPRSPEYLTAMPLLVTCLNCKHILKGG